MVWDFPVGNVESRESFVVDADILIDRLIPGPTVKLASPVQMRGDAPGEFRKNGEPSWVE